MATEPVDGALRRLRPIVGAALVIYVVIRNGGSHVGVRSVAVVIAATALIAVSRVVSVRLESGGPRLRRFFDGVGVAIDAGVTVLVITRFDLLEPELGWALLVVPVLEGALRFRIRGAVVVWSGITAAYVALQISIPANLGDPVTQTAFLQQIQTLVYRSGIVLLVAVPGGYLSDQLLRAIAAQRLAQLAANERNALLVRVVDAGRSLSRWGIDVPAAVVDSSMALGFDMADWAYLDPRQGWLTSHHRSRHDGVQLPPPAALGDLCAQVARLGRTMIADTDDEDPRIRNVLKDLGIQVVLAAPIRGRGGTLAVLRVGTERGMTPTPQQVESIELLAGQAGVAGDNAKLLSEIHVARTDLEHQANHDGLTGLPNRLQFQRQLADSISELSERNRPLSVLFLDLDRFKEVNDNFGHEVGDELLRVVAKRLQRLVRSEDMVARLGGDEFIILAPGADPAAASLLATRVVEHLAEPFRLRDHAVSLGASVGIVVTRTPMDAGELIRRGDLAMYQAKAFGRSTWRMYSPELDHDGRAQARIEADLRIALDDRQLSAAYQPVLRLSDQSLVGVEALVRWDHPQLGMLSPDRFIPVAERSGLIDMLGRFMLETTCAHARRWSDTTPGADLYIAVNVSPRQVRREGFVDYVLGLLRSHGLPADMLVLELTERVVIEADVIEPLAVLRRAGVRVALDDFGQGYTSFGALSRMPIDILKIDRAFISELHRKPQQAAIVRTMISLGHDLGLTVVAEGVESVEESDHLSTLRCDCVQGYQFHAPMTAEAFGALSAAPQRGDGRAAIAPSRYPQAGAHPMMAGD